MDNDILQRLKDLGRIQAMIKSILDAPLFEDYKKMEGDEHLSMEVNCLYDNLWAVYDIARGQEYQEKREE